MKEAGQQKEEENMSEEVEEEKCEYFTFYGFPARDNSYGDPLKRGCRIHEHCGGLCPDAEIKAVDCTRLSKGRCTLGKNCDDCHTAISQRGMREYAHNVVAGIKKGIPVQIIGSPLVMEGVAEIGRGRAALICQLF